jgi:hypothetical protein
MCFLRLHLRPCVSSVAWLPYDGWTLLRQYSSPFCHDEIEVVALTLIVPVLNSSSPQAVAADLPEFDLVKRFNQGPRNFLPRRRRSQHCLPRTHSSDCTGMTVLDACRLNMPDALQDIVSSFVYHRVSLSAWFLEAGRNQPTCNFYRPGGIF